MTAPGGGGGGGYGYKVRPDPGSRVVPAGEPKPRINAPPRAESRRGAIAARNAVSAAPIPGIRETRSGLVFRDQFNRADGAIGADWNNIAGGANWSIAANALKNASTASDERIVVADAKMPELLGEMVVQAKMRRVGANRNTFPGVRSNWSNPDGSGGGQNCYVAFITNNGASNVLELHRLLAGVGTTLVQSGNYVTTDLKPYKLFTKPGEQKVWVLNNDLFTIELLLSAADAALDALTGRGGLSAGWFQATTDTHEYDDFSVYRGNTVRMSGLPSGYKLNVVHPTGGADVSAVEADGVAVADLVGRGCPFTKVEVRTAGDIVLHSLAPSLGVWGGGEYEVAW